MPKSLGSLVGKFRLRSWKSGLLGGMAGVVFMLILVLRTSRPEDYAEFPLYSLVVLSLSPVMAILAAQRTTPANQYLNHLTGFVTEFLSTLLFPFLGAILIAPLLLSSVGAWILALPLLPAVVRVGTLLAYGKFVDRRWNWLAQVVVGVATGFLALAIANFFIWKVNPYNTSTVVAWIVFLPMSFVTANAFAAIDNEISPIRPFIGRAGTLLCILILLPFIALTAIVFKLGRNAYYLDRGPNLDRIFEKIVSAPALTHSSPTVTSSPEG